MEPSISKSAQAAAKKKQSTSSITAARMIGFNTK
jgi:hypothetical protein